MKSTFRIYSNKSFLMFSLLLSMFHLFCADTSLGRIDYSSLSQQTLMELLVSEISNKDTLYSSDSDPGDVLEWKGLSSNEKSEIVRIGWSNMELEGSILLQWLPQTVTHLYLWGNRLKGTLDLSALPSVLKVMNIHSNAFEGTFDLSYLPGSLETLILAYTKLTGTLDFRSLKPGIRLVNVHKTLFEGELDFSQIPESVQLIDVRNTKLSGKVQSVPCRTIWADQSNVKIVE